MKSRNSSIDASSIADIAFILLAFIMIATTLKPEEGIPARLPEKSTAPPTAVVDENVLEIFINKNEEIKIEEEYNQSLEDVKIMTKLFMTEQSKTAKYKRFDFVTKASCNQKIAELTQKQNQGMFYSSDDIDYWKTKLETVKLIGEYKTLNKASAITIKYNKSVSYGKYLEIRDYILRGINELRNELANEKFGVSYSDLESIRMAVKTKEEIKMQKAIKEVYPTRILKLVDNN